jgi:hypothetical protein
VQSEQGRPKTVVLHWIVGPVSVSFDVEGQRHQQAFDIGFRLSHVAVERLRYLSGNVGENQMIVRECDVK